MMNPHEQHVAVRPVRGEEISETSEEPVEIFLVGSQRYWVKPDSFLGLSVRQSIDKGDVLGVIYNQIEDASNPFGSIFSTLDSLELMEVAHGSDEWRTWLEDFELGVLRERLYARVDELASGLEAGTTEILGLDLEKFKSVVTMMMNERSGLIERKRIPQGDSAHRVFDLSLSGESSYRDGKYFFYYPDGDQAPQSEHRLSALSEKIATLKALSPKEFIGAMFRDLADSVYDGESDILSAPRYASASVFARTVYQKFYALTYAIRLHIEEDRPILLGGGHGEPPTLREIREELDRARKRRIEERAGA